MRSEDRDNHLSLRVSHVRAPEEISPWICLYSAGHSVGVPCCHSITPTPTYRITRDTQFPINSPVTKLIIQTARHTRSFIETHRICLDKGWNPACGHFLPHRRAGHGFPPSGEVYPSHAIFWCGSRERAGGRGMESAAGLIGSQPCDIHCLLGASQGTGDNWVDSLGGCISGGGWHSCGDFFSFFLLGMGRRRRGGADHTLVPATPEPTPRA